MVGSILLLVRGRDGAASTEHSPNIAIAAKVTINSTIIMTIILTTMKYLPGSPAQPAPAEKVTAALGLQHLALVLESK